MPKTLCKGVKKDGTPCQGQGQEKYGGYCIAHAPKEITDEWRTRGGKNSSNAARSRKHIPEPFDGIIQELRQGLSEVREGKLSPSQLNAMCNGARAISQLVRLSNEESDLIRAHEIESAAMDIAGAQGDLAILDAAAKISAERERYWAESFIQQGLAIPEPGTTRDSDAPPALVLTDAGRRRFGLQKLTGYTQDDLDQIEALLKRPVMSLGEWSAADKLLSAMHTSIEEALADLECAPVPVRDPLTGETLTEPPAGVKIGPVNGDDEISTKAALEMLKEQRQKVQLFTRILEFRYRNELSVLRLPPMRKDEDEEEKERKKAKKKKKEQKEVRGEQEKKE
ncbi:MAG: hypothetical protein OXI80_08335 [Caldilineaceae bacterium]|nr:hypothetical protein [Caldilineaceae bacterium]MDE0337665.1 hypothetical protein [Caldilineaceae bacterium]